MTNQQLSIILETFSFFFVGIDLYGHDRLEKTHNNLRLLSEKVISEINNLHESGWSPKKSKKLMDIIYIICGITTISTIIYLNFKETDWGWTISLCSSVCLVFLLAWYILWILDYSANVRKVLTYLLIASFVLCSILIFNNFQQGVKSDGSMLLLVYFGLVGLIFVSYLFSFGSILIGVSLLLLLFVSILWLMKNLFFILKKTLDITKFEGVLLTIGTIMFIISKYIQLFY